MKIYSVMTTDVATCAPDETLKDAALKMWECDCGFVPVVREGKLEGVLTDRDICMAACFQDQPLSQLRVRDVMIRDVEACRPDSELEEVHDLMARSQIRRVPIVSENGDLVGIVSVNDVVLRANDADAGTGDGCAAVPTTLAAISTHRQTATGSSASI